MNAALRTSSKLSEDFTSAGARRAAERGQLEPWVHSYLLGPGGNQPFSDGLKRRIRYWRAPELLPLGLLQRTCGPECDMPFREPVESWQKRVGEIASSFRELELFPPLIAQYVSGRLLVSDGSHRLAAFERLGLTDCWVIVWYADEVELDHHQRRAFVWKVDHGV
jgi:hypothetical protein